MCRQASVGMTPQIGQGCTCPQRATAKAGMWLSRGQGACCGKAGGVLPAPAWAACHSARLTRGSRQTCTAKPACTAAWCMRGHSGKAMGMRGDSTANNWGCGCWVAACAGVCKPHACGQSACSAVGLCCARLLPASPSSHMCSSQRPRRRRTAAKSRKRPFSGPLWRGANALKNPGGYLGVRHSVMRFVLIAMRVDVGIPEGALSS